MNKLILLVEDNPDDADLTLAAFRETGFPHEIKVARDGAEALELLRSAAAPPLMVLLDLKMPKVSGLEVLRRMKAVPALSRVPVIVLTSSAEEKDRTEAAALGADLYIQKAVNYAEFLAIARRVGDLLPR